MFAFDTLFRQSLSQINFKICFYHSVCGPSPIKINSYETLLLGKKKKKKLTVNLHAQYRGAAI